MNIEIITESKDKVTNIVIEYLIANKAKFGDKSMSDRAMILYAKEHCFI